MKAFELHFGSKKLYGIADDAGRVTLRTDCTEFPDAVVEIRLTAAQAEALEQPRRATITSIIPEIAPAVREIFISGTTPAEWDALFNGKLRSQAAYEELGYRFPEEDAQP
jgi:hypothetical protein